MMSADLFPILWCFKCKFSCQFGLFGPFGPNPFFKIFGPHFHITSSFSLWLDFRKNPQSRCNSTKNFYQNSFNPSLLARHLHNLYQGLCTNFQGRSFNMKEMHLIDNYLKESAMISIIYSSRGRREITLPWEWGTSWINVP